MKKITLCGLMSGSSLDGLDIAVVEFNTREDKSIDWNIIHLEVFDFPMHLKSTLKNSTGLPIQALLAVETEFSQWCAKTINELPPKIFKRIDAIAIHGHTTTHQPSMGFSNQLVNGWQLAAKSGKKVITDFRNNDIAHGGQGGPLAPVCEKHLFPEHKLFLNLGGIANISLHTDDSIIGYDICPFNQVFNYFANKMGQPYDNNGEIASSGEVDEVLANIIKDNPYFLRSYPKSIDNAWVAGNILSEFISSSISVPDKLRTAVSVFAELIAKEIILLNKISGKKLSTYVTGGGAWNSFAIDSINAILAEAEVPPVTIPQPDIVNGKEAILMALMGYLKLQRIPNSFSSVTGADRDTINGIIYES